MDHHMYHDHDQYQHQMTSPYNTILTTQPPPTTTMIMDDEKKMMTTMTSTRPQEPRNCPRCNSSNTKFCYYNNYSLAQPRYLCKSCRRYWTEGGSLRNVPVGGGSRKNKKVPLLLPNSSSSSTSTSKNLPDLNPPFAFTSSSNPNKTLQSNNDLSLSFSSHSKQGQGHYGHFTNGQNSFFQAPIGMIQFRQQENDHGHSNNKTNLGFSLDKEETDGINIHQETFWNNHSRQSPDRVFPSGLQHQELKTVKNDNHNNFSFNGGGSKMMYPYGDHDDHHSHHDHERHDDGNKKRESGSSNELWSGIILGGDHSGGPTW